jgi:hypothetical protein
MGLKERGRAKPGNKALIKREPCLATGRYGVDPCHFPYRRSEVHDDGMLFLIPLVREWHTLVDNYEEPYRTMVERLAISFHRRKIEGWRTAGLYLGPEWRIDEVENG